MVAAASKHIPEGKYPRVFFFFLGSLGIQVLSVLGVRKSCPFHGSLSDWRGEGEWLCSGPWTRTVVAPAQPKPSLLLGFFINLFFFFF